MIVRNAGEERSRGHVTGAAVIGVAAAVLLAGSPAEASSRWKVATLGGQQEVPPVATEASGCARFEIDTVKNVVHYHIAYSGLSSAEAAAHIHGPAEPGQNAGVVHPLPAGSPKVGTWNYSEDLEADILEGRLYVNIHTADNPGGELRGQVVDLVAVINQDQVNPPTGSGAQGFGLFDVNTVTNELEYYIVYDGLGASETVSHIHGFALHTTGAGVLHGLPLGTLKTGTWSYDESQEKRLLDGEAYVNIHSSDFPGGEIRGQIVRIVAPADGEQENPPVDSPGHGCALFAHGDADDTLSYYVRHGNLTGPATAAHIHGYAGPEGNAGVLHNIGATTPTTGAWNYPADREDDVLAGLTYVNVHTSAHGGGEVRGQVIIPGAPCPTDADCSGATDFGDILQILSAWGGAAGAADVDRSGTVDFGDILAVLSAWGPCP